MGEHSTVIDVIVIAMLGLLCLLTLITVIQNNDTQEKLVELTMAVKMSAARHSTPAARTGLPETPGAFINHSGKIGVVTRDGMELCEGEPVYMGPDGVKEVKFGGLRVRVEPYRNPRAVPGDILRQSYSSDPPGLNPHVNQESFSSSLFWLCNDSLAERDFDDPKRYIPKLARKWEIRQQVRVYLKEGKHAAELVTEMEADLGGPPPWTAYDITSIQPDGDGVIVINTNSIASSYEQLIDKRLKDSLREVHYVYAESNPFYKGAKKVDIEDVVEAVKAKSGKWNLLKSRIQTDHFSAVFLVTGDAGALKKYLNGLLAPNVADNLEDVRGKVSLVDTRKAEVSASITFHLRRGVYWQSVSDPRPGHEGELFPRTEYTADDAEFTWRRIVTNLEVPCDSTRNYYNDLEDVKAVDRYTLKFEWFRPYFMLFTMSTGLEVMPRHVYDFKNAADFVQSPLDRIIVGNGMWRMEKWKENREIVLVRNEDYWDRKAYLEAIIYKCVKEPSVELTMFKDSKLDLVGLSAEQWKTERSKPEFQAVARTDDTIANVYRYVGYNARHSFFSDTRVRRAMTMLIDREAIIHDIYNDTVVPTTGPFHVQSPYYNHEVKPWPYDPQRSGHLLAEAGWRDTDGDGIIDKNGKRFEYELLYPANVPEYNQMGNLVKESDEKAGIIVNLHSLEWASFLKRINDQNFDACILGWSGGFEGDPYQLWHSSQTVKEGSNFCYFVNREADDIIVKARYILDPQTRYRMYHRLHEIIHEEQPYTFLFIQKRRTAYSIRLEDLKFSLLGNTLDRVWVKSENQALHYSE